MLRSSFRLWLAASLLVWGCAVDSETEALRSERDEYLALITTRDGDPEELLAACGRLSDPQLAGDCGLVIIGSGSLSSAAAAERLCPLVVEGLYQDECWFLAAEAAGRRSERDAAKKLCDRAGSFASACNRHQIQGELRRLAQGAEFADLGEAEVQMLAVRAFWGNGEVNDATLRADRTFFQSIFEAAGAVDAARCAPVSDLRRELCEQAAREVDRRARRPGNVGGSKPPPSTDRR